jgi:phage gp16-like protein
VSAIAAIHTAARQLGLEEDDRRDLYQRVTGRRSLTEMSPRQQTAVLEELRRQGFKPAKTALQGRFARKLQALWIDAWQLGLVQDRRDSALIAFVKRQTGIEHLNWVNDAGDAARVAEALKGWMTREAGVDWSLGNHLPNWMRLPGAKVVVAQWTILANAGAVERDFAAFRSFCEDRSFNRLTEMTPREWANVMKTLGARVRKVRR